MLLYNQVLYLPTNPTFLLFV
uniref:Uncharacterized protein n=1 Tax=Anguilla anguilla TaxID=7936 RepID=A0A0E9T467_ANGAN